MPRSRASRLPVLLSLAGFLVLPSLLSSTPAGAVTPPVIIAPTGGSYDNVGYAVATAGDVNGDGYADVIVGSTNSAAGDAGIYFGGPKADATADIQMTGAASGDHFGLSVGPAGDVNGDGYDDWIVGACGNDAAGADAGAAYIYFGGPGVDAVADVVLTGVAVGDNFGYAARTAGDVNHDGYDDVVVSARHGHGGAANSGTAYVFFGGATMDATADLTLAGEVAGDYFGCSVGTAGDVNGDGYADVIVGASEALLTGGGSMVGKAYLYLGGASPNAVADLVMTNGLLGEYFGCSVGTAGDMNGDGYDDVIVGAFSHSRTGANFIGAAYVYFGAATPNAVADLTVHGSAASEELGTSVGTAGDVNGDGYDDVIVGAVGRSITASNAGGAFVFLGGASPDTVADLTLNGAHAEDRFGYEVAAAGDVNGDGFDDVIVGAYGSDVGGPEGGQAFVYDMGPPPAAANRTDLTLLGAVAADRFGISAGTAGDVNGDGFDDVIVGAFHNDVGGAEAGRAYVYFGGPGADAVADWVLTGTAAADYFGLSVGTAGDVNGDGYDDVVVGAYGAGSSDAGRAYVFFGGTSPDPVADLTLIGAAASDAFGYSVGTAGDVNHDGYDDVIVGAHYNDAGGTNAGRAYVFFGGASPDNVADWTLTGVAAGDYFGWAVGTAGDVNGDGYDDVVVGAPENDAGGTTAGMASIFYGAVSPDAVPDVTLMGTAAGDYFGRAVGTAGDVNGDGYADVLVGAPNNDAGGSNAGRAYLFYGAASSVAGGLVFTGAAAADYFGSALGTAGDVNGDGYADVVVGAYWNDAGGTNAGRAYVYYGGWRADNTADILLTGHATNDQFGQAVGTAGDVNGDGFADVIVGASMNDGAGTDAGAAYVHDCNRYFVTYPNGGETWAADGAQVVQWLGAERADVWLSVNDGATYELLVGNEGGSESNTAEVTVPHVVTELARVRLAPYEVWTTGSDTSDAVFTIADLTGVESGDPALRFRAPWPNPSHGLVRFGVELARPVMVTVTVLDVAGREVARPIAGEKFGAGKVEREWRPADLAPGVYTVRAKVGETRFTRRLVWLGAR